MHHTTSARLGATWLTLATILATCTACGPDFSEEGLGTEIPFDPDRPSVSRQAEQVAPYQGDDPNVKIAATRFSNGLELHRKVIWRTCTPNEGVCHNQKEYPDLHTVENFAAAIDAPCNVQPGQETSVYDGCERTGDRFSLAGVRMNKIEIGHISYVPGEHTDFSKEEPPTVDSPGLHITLHDAVPVDKPELRDGGQFTRDFVTSEGDVAELVFATYDTRWWILEGGAHIYGEVRDNQRDRVTELLQVGIIQGDLNRNGVYGARDSKPISMLQRGDPERSYLIARIRGQISEPMGGGGFHDVKIPGSRMPLANKPLDISEMLALFCFVEGLPAEGDIDMTRPIDYAGCSYTSDPENLNLLGEGVTWTRRVQKILTANCGGCHGGEQPDAGLDLLSEGAYERLLQPSMQQPEVALIKPGEPENSYLWIKISGEGEFTGARMPIDPLQGERMLTEAELGDIQTWIVNGAVENE